LAFPDRRKEKKERFVEKDNKIEREEEEEESIYLSESSLECEEEEMLEQEIFGREDKGKEEQEKDEEEESEDENDNFFEEIELKSGLPLQHQ